MSEIHKAKEKSISESDIEVGECNSAVVFKTVKFPVTVKKTIWQTVRVPVHINLENPRCVEECKHHHPIKKEKPCHKKAKKADA